MSLMTESEPWIIGGESESLFIGGQFLLEETQHPYHWRRVGVCVCWRTRKAHVHWRRVGVDSHWEESRSRFPLEDKQSPCLSDDGRGPLLLEEGRSPFFIRREAERNLVRGQEEFFLYGSYCRRVGGCSFFEESRRLLLLKNRSPFLLQEGRRLFPFDESQSLFLFEDKRRPSCSFLFEEGQSLFLFESESVLIRVGVCAYSSRGLSLFEDR